MPVIAERSPALESTFDFSALSTEAEVNAEARKSFDVLASVNMLRVDLLAHDRILPETRERILDEELSLIAEGMDRVARTEFPLQRRDNDLTYYKNGNWESYTGMLLIGRDVAIKEAQADPRKRFLADDAVRDLQYGYKMRALKPGEQLVWASPYPHDVADRYGDDFMRACGRFPDRKMGFLYRAYCADNGNVILESQTIDQSNDEALAAALDSPNADMDTMVDAYDSVLERKHGERFYAGRRDAEIRENVWNTVRDQRDLVEYFVYKLEAIARSPLRGQELETATKKHIYGVWAAFKKRISGDSQMYRPPRDMKAGFPAVHMALMDAEVMGAFNDFVSRGVAMVGCGGRIEMLQGLDDIMNAEAEDVFDGIFGKKGSSNKDCDYISKQCPMCGTKKVRTIDKGIGGSKRRISGSCGCSKVYVKST